MPLSNQDIEHIRALGFNTNFFVIEIDGWLQLKNHDGRCVFHNGKICSIYKDRPEGCRLYPIIYDKDKSCAIFDEDCPHRNKFQMPKSIIKQLNNTVSRLESERVKRKRNGN
jgi:Fe-S-cluster containining protein